MSDIAPVSRPQPAAINGQSRSGKPEPASAAKARGSDSVELSSQAKLLSKLKDLPDVRDGLVNSVRAQIDTGQYETEERLDTAINGLIEDLF
ncbi:MAG: flagellar biosynthesis anti-sigma factor FlgM [Planctomycetota bacterium]